MLARRAGLHFSEMMLRSALSMNEIPRAFRRTSGFALPGVSVPPNWRERALRHLRRLHQRMRSVRAMFCIVVLVPTSIATIYYGVIASKRYVSEAEYIVRGVNTHHAGGLDAILTSFGISRAADDTSAIQSYIESHDAIRALNERLPLRDIYARPEADYFARFKPFWRKDTFESLYEYTQHFITINQDPTKGITTLRVVTFRPEDSKAIAATLLTLAEEMVNRMNDRAQADAIRNARDEVTLAEEKISQAQAELTAFRNREMLVDPVAFSSTMLGGVSKLSLDLAQTSTEIKETLHNSPANPGLPALRARAAALQQRIEIERKKMAGDDTALAGKVAAYEHLTLMRDLADKSFAAALTALEGARQEARRQQIYIEEMVRPNLPDEDTEPKRFRSILTVFVLSFAVFSMIWILTVGAKDHAQ
jgi:capsular polysaccharide transport system permease protein